MKRLLLVDSRLSNLDSDVDEDFTPF